jgi:hypothetical protein
MESYASRMVWASYTTNLFTFDRGVDVGNGRGTIAAGALLPGVELGVRAFDRIA